VVGDRRLRQRNVVLHVTGAHAHAFSDGTLAFLLEQPENLEPRGVGHGLEGENELLVRKRHRFIYTRKHRRVPMCESTTEVGDTENCQKCQNCQKSPKLKIKPLKG
jgi:hypothetical protein